LGSSVSFTPMNKGGLRGMWYKTAGNPRVKRKSPPYASIWTQKLGADPSRGGQSGMASGWVVALPRFDCHQLKSERWRSSEILPRVRYGGTVDQRRPERLAWPWSTKYLSLTRQRKKRVKIGAEVVTHWRS